jgi:xanthine/CO dehydrogenase XdhC/CoxF family maturation factor/CTP:molybdopterin cytidylyltransferase MocA
VSAELRAVLDACGRIRRQGSRAALATVVCVEGSAYRRPGARMVVTEDGLTTGSLSGGCLERDVCERAARVMAGCRPEIAVYDTRSEADIVWGTGAGCSGLVQVLIEPAGSNGLAQQIDFLEACVARRERGVMVTVFRVDGAVEVCPGSRLMVDGSGQLVDGHIVPALAQAVLGDARDALATGQTTVREYPLGDSGHMAVLIEVIEPPVSLVIFGASADAVPVVELARTLGWRTTIFDTSARPATRQRFTCADSIRLCRPEDAGAIPLSSREVVLLMTHNYLHDLELLKLLLRSPVQYIGCLGPRRRTERLLSELAGEITLDEEQTRRVFAPVGLDIGAEQPEEIALSIVAEICAMLHGRRGAPLRDRSLPIHDRREGAAEGIAAIILAAGASTRMGRPKQLLPSFGGQSLLRRSAIEAVRSGCRPVVVVTGAHAEQSSLQVGDLPVQVIHNPDWAGGMSSSLRAGLTALDAAESGAAAVIVTLCDQPFARAHVLEELVGAYRSSGRGIVASEYDGVLGVPALFARKHFEELAELRSAVGARQLIAAHAGEVVRVPFPEGSIDIDTWEDYSGFSCRVGEEQLR